MEEGFKNLSIHSSCSSFQEKPINRRSFVFPGDLIVEILLRLPVKSLLRFEATSKPWKSLICSSKFIAIHHQQQKKNAANVKFLTLYNIPRCTHNFPPFSLCYCSLKGISGPTISNGILLISKNDDGSIISRDLAHSPVYFGFQSLSIVGCSNGLVCVKFCYNKSGICGGDYGWDRRFGIWNPATRKFKLLPAPQPVSTSEFENLENTIVGFSYITSTCSYKLVQVLVFAKYGRDNVKRFSARVEVLNMGEKSWREVVCQGQEEAIHEVGWDISYLEASRDYRHNQPVVANGSVYWLGFLEDRGDILVSFDLNKEVFAQTALPHPKGFEVKLAVFEDNLAAFVTSPDSSDEIEHDVDVWIYEVTSQTWTKQFSFGPLPKHDDPVGFWANGEIIVMGKLSRFWYQDLEAYLYKINGKEKKNFPCSEVYSNMAFEPYVESLVDF